MDKRYAWKRVPPKNGEPSTKKMRSDGKDKIYHWCPHHNQWTIHTAAECKRSKPTRGKKDYYKKDKKAIKRQNFKDKESEPMTYEEEDFEEEDLHTYAQDTQEYIGQVIFKRIPFRMKSLAEEKLKCSEVQRFQWLQTTSNGDFLTLWISHNSNTMMTNAIRLKLNWERELPPNSPERKLVSLIIVEQVAPRSYRPLLAKLKNELVNMRENGTFVPTFVQTVKYEANSGTLAYVYQQKTIKSGKATISR